MSRTVRYCNFLAKTSIPIPECTVVVPSQSVSRLEIIGRDVRRRLVGPDRSDKVDLRIYKEETLPDRARRVNYGTGLAGAPNSEAFCPSPMFSVCWCVYNFYFSHCLCPFPWAVYLYYRTKNNRDPPSKADR